jgi:hypothetical protein
VDFLCFNNTVKYARSISSSAIEADSDDLSQVGIALRGFGCCACLGRGCMSPEKTTIFTIVLSALVKEGL